MKAAGRTGAIVVGILACLTLSAPAASAQQEGSTERPFVAGGQVRMDLSAGDYTIEPGQDNRILVRWDTRSSDDATAVKVNIQIQGGTATITTSGPRNNFKVVIELPAREDLRVELSAGNLKIRGIEGSKDVGSWAGNIDIAVGKASDYASVDASVTAGDLLASAFQTTKGGLFRSLSWKGPGRYTLKVKLTAGNIRLYE
jgi:hypothetical protein